MTDTQLFDVPPDSAAVTTSPEATTVSPIPTPIPAPTTPTVKRKKPGPSLCSKIESELKSRSIPYVAVDEAKKAMFLNTKLQAFHLVIYSQQGSNWLVLCGEGTAYNREQMQKWAEVFGDGFIAVLAVKRVAGIEFRTLSGEKLKLDDLRP